MPEAVRRPATDALVALADRCVQCGLCLPACPTYGLDRMEAESPRGRIALARAWETGVIAPTPAGDTHLDHCLGCRRCEAVCPAGVEYGPLLIHARTRQRERRSPGWGQRLVEAMAARPRGLAWLLAAYRIAFPLLPGALRPLPRPPQPFPRSRATTGADHHGGLEDRSSNPGTPVRGRERETVAVFLGCVARPYEVGVRDALRRLCAAADVPLSEPAGQTCCGTLHAHAGDARVAGALAARNRAAFAGAGTVLTLASGCHEALAAGLGDTATVTDALAFLAGRADRLRFRPIDACVALHLPCTQRNVVRSDGAVRSLLARVPGLRVSVLDAGFGCCGAAGSHMLGEPERAAAYRQPLLDQFSASGAERMLSANIGCRLHFANATRVPVQHPLEFLAQCLP